MSRFLIPVLLIVGSTSAVLIGGLLWLTAKQDDMEAVREVQSVRASYDAQVEWVGKLDRDYAVWDDMVRYAVLRLDRKWLDDNLGVYLLEQYGFEHAYVVAPDGRTAYGMVDGKPTNAAVEELLGAGYRRAAGQVLRERKGSGRYAGLTQTPKGLAIFAVETIRPNTEDVHLPPGKPYRLVMAKRLDSAALAELTKRTTGLRLQLGLPKTEGPGSLPLVTQDGQVAASLIWQPNYPGQQLRRDVTPFVVVLLIGVFILAANVLRRAWGAARELVAGEARSRHMAHHDQLTGLPNRRALTEYLLNLSRVRTPYAVMFMDLDGFKEVNDAFGHSTGDRLLQRTADRLRRARPSSSYVARLGGDEFALVLPGETEAASLQQAADALVSAVDQPHDFGAEPIVVGVSIGIAVAGDLMEMEETIRRADVAMYAAKARGRNRACAYDAELDDGRVERKLLEGELRRAVANGDITIAYQPIVRTADKKIMGLEALARWTHPVRGPISPDIFIPVAEESGVIVELGRYVLREACMAARNWPYKLSVNLSPAQFWENGLVEGVLSILKECDFPPEQLELEITETYLLRRPEAASEVISALRASGIRVALDDFGTGYASIGYLRRFELDLVKLDRSFVEHVATDPGAADIAHAVIALGSALKLPILAEGVETQAQATVLSTAGCSFMQGWHYGHPMPAAEVPALLSPAASAA